MSFVSTPIGRSRRPVGSSGSAALNQPIFGVPHPAEALSTLRQRHEPVKPADNAVSRAQGGVAKKPSINATLDVTASLAAYIFPPG